MESLLYARGRPVPVRLATALLILVSLLALLVAAPVAAAPPANDNRASAEAILAFPATFAGTTVEATVETLDPQVSKCGPIEGTVWYRIGPAPDGTLTFSLQGDGLTPVIRVYTMDKSGIDELACGTAAAGKPAQALFAATRGANYLVVVGKRPGTPDAAFTLQATQTLPPQNDSRGQAAPVPAMPATVTGSTVAATFDPETDSADCGLERRGSVWYSLDPAGAERILLSLRVAGGIDLGLALFVKTRSQIEELGCRKTDRSGRLTAAFDTIKGSTYLIMVGTRTGSQPGGFALDASVAPIGQVKPADMIFTRPPANDGRVQATRVPRIPATAAGSTVAATFDPETDSGGCGLGEGASVWYALSPAGDKRILLTLRVAGRIDAGLAVFEKTRSQVEGMGCAKTDRDGKLAVAFDTVKGSTYLVMVGTLEGSRPGEFVLDASYAEPREKAPGKPLGPAGITGKVDWITDVNDVYSADLQAGTTYSIAFLTDGAVVTVTGPRGKLVTFERSGYRTFTPGPASAGRYAFDVTAPKDEGTLTYRLTVKPADPDDVGAGLSLVEGVSVKGSIAPETADVVDVYHFVVASDRSNIRVTLATRPKSGLTLTLTGPSGEKVAAVPARGRRSEALERVLPAGRYLVTVQGKLGKKEAGYAVAYAVRRRTVATIKVPRGDLPSNVRADIRVAVSPAPTTGDIVVRIERYDETDGWVFAKTIRMPVPGGPVEWQPTALGRWRVSARYPGTLGFSASSTKVHEFTLVRSREAAPGQPLARAGVSGKVDWTTDVNDVYWTRADSGTTYIVAFTSSCAKVAMTTPAGETTTISCNGFRAFTPGPGESGRVVFDVTAPEDRGSIPYRLVVKPAGTDDLGLGTPFRNLEIVRGTLDPAAADVVDLYRFALTDDRSDVRLRLTTERGSGIAMTLISATGRRIDASAKVIKRSLGAGQYILAVRGTMGKPGGDYAFRLVARHYTSTTVSLASPTMWLGSTVYVRVAVEPRPSAGTLEVRIDRYDPSLGWVYSRTLDLSPSGGSTAWTPTILGRYRLQASYSGSIEHTPSRSPTATVEVTDAPW